MDAHGNSMFSCNPQWSKTIHSQENRQYNSWNSKLSSKFCPILLASNPHAWCFQVPGICSKSLFIKYVVLFGVKDSSWAERKKGLENWLKAPKKTCGSAWTWPTCTPACARSSSTMPCSRCSSVSPTWSTCSLWPPWTSSYGIVDRLSYSISLKDPLNLLENNKLQLFIFEWWYRYPYCMDAFHTMCLPCLHRKGGQ